MPKQGSPPFSAQSDGYHQLHVSMMLRILIKPWHLPPRNEYSVPLESQIMLKQSMRAGLFEVFFISCRCSTV
jgi:hypothetical protein